MSTHHLRAAALATFVAMLAVPSVSHAQASAPAPPQVPRQAQAPVPEPKRPFEAPRQEITPEPVYVSFRPVFRLGQDYTLKAGDQVREVVGIMANVQIDGHVDGDTVVVAGNVTLASTAVVEGSLVVVGGMATIQQGARVDRDLVVVGGTVEAPADFAPRGEHVVIGTPVIGNSIKAIMPWFTRGLLWGRLIVPDLGWIWAIVGIVFLVGVVLNHLFDRQVAACADTLVQRPLSAFFMGLLVMLVTGPLLIILAASVIGLAVVPFAVVALIVAKIIGKIGVTRAIGRGVMAEDELGNRAQSLRSYVLGSAIIVLAYMVPIIGILTYLMVGTFGLGSATLAFVARWRRERAVPPVAPAPQPPTGPPSSPSSDAYGATPQGPAPTYGAPAASAFVAAGAPVVMEAAAADMVSEGAPPSPPPPPRPSPGVAASAGAAGDLLLYPRASFFDRIAALVLDVILIAIANNMLDLFWRDGGFLLLVFAYHIGFWAWKGTTLGGIICNVRIVRTSGGDPRFIDALVRGLTGIFSVVALGIGVFWMLNDAERQMWHDKIAGTVVVKLPRALVLA